MALEYFYITNNQSVALACERAGVDRIFVDMEYIGKDKRQKGLDTVKNHHTVQDVKNIMAVIKKSKLMVRVNPIHSGSVNEINSVIAAGADFIMLPMWKTVEDVKQFLDIVDGRAKTMLLLETEEARLCLDDVLKLSVPNSTGEMVPFSSFTKVEEQLGQNQINRYNMYSTASLTCNVAPGSSTGQAIQEVEALFKEQLGDEFGYEWTSVAYQETQAGNTTTIVLIMALIVAFLVLAAQYESWTSPVAAVIGLPVALLGAMIGCLIMGTPVSIYTQIGIILLVALSAKNGILIVEFARDFRAEGNSIREAAFEAGHVRLRPILMTSFAFVLGVMPLLFATGAGAQSRIALGAAVVFGMAMNTLLATIYIPNFYEFMQKLQERFSKKKGNEDSEKDVAV